MHPDDAGAFRTKDNSLYIWAFRVILGSFWCFWRHIQTAKNQITGIKCRFELKNQNVKFQLFLAVSFLKKFITVYGVAFHDIALWQPNDPRPLSTPYSFHPPKIWISWAADFCPYQALALWQLKLIQSPTHCFCKRTKQHKNERTKTMKNANKTITPKKSRNRRKRN